MGKAVTPSTLGVSGWRLHGQRTGVGRYILNLIRHWTPEIVADRFGGITIYTPEALPDDAAGFPAGVREKVIGPPMSMLAWENLRLGPSARETVMLYPSYSRPVLSRATPVVVTHDATMRLHPELYSRKDKLIYDPFYGWSARSSAFVITTTEAARLDIAREWNVDPEKIRVTHLASAECFRPLPQSLDRDEMRMRLTGSTTPFFLFVGKLSGRRNLPRLLEGFAEFRARSPHPHRLVIVGPQYAITAVEKMADDLNVRSSLVTRNFIADEELNELYNCADAFVMPSTYETVSFPIMEAQAAGTPVICIDTPGSREITGGEALLIPRLDVKELFDAMVRIVSDRQLHAGLAERGLRNSNNFSWERCAVKTLDVCAEAARLSLRAS